MDTKFIMAMVQDKLPNNKSEIQAINDKLNALDEKTRNEVALEISSKTTDTYIGVLVE